MLNRTEQVFFAIIVGCKCWDCIHSARVNYHIATQQMLKAIAETQYEVNRQAAAASTSNSGMSNLSPCEIGIQRIHRVAPSELCIQVTHMS